VTGSLVTSAGVKIVYDMLEERQNPPPPPPPNDGVDMLIKFLKLTPPTFDGTSDSIQYEYWKRKIEGLFEVMERCQLLIICLSLMN